MGMWSAYLYIYTKHGTQYKAGNIPEKKPPSRNHLRACETLAFSDPLVDVLAQVGPERGPEQCVNADPAAP